MKRILLFILFSASVISGMARTDISDTIPTAQLDEVVIQGEKPQIKGEDGIMVVDLPAIVKDKPVSNLLDALKYLPGVTEQDGIIGLTGASGVTIILNGQLTNMPLENLYQLLNTTPVDRLKTVEVMYTAPAKYHVSGAVINIVLKTPNPLDGLQGQMRGGYNLQHFSSYNGALAATYAVKDWAFDLNYGLKLSKTWNHEHTFSNHLYQGSRTMIDDNMRRSSRSLNNTIYASAAYKDFKITYNGQITCRAKGLSRSDGSLGNFINSYVYDGPINYHNLAARYQAPFGLTVCADYTRYSERLGQTLSQDAAPLLNSLNRQAIDRWHFYADQEHQLGRWGLSYGVEYRQSDDVSSQTYEASDVEGFSGKTSEKVADAYVGLQGSFDWGLSFNASAKEEYFHNDYRHNWNFIPELGATFYKPPKSIFQLNFTAQRVYPAFWELHSRTSFINPYAEIIGNPELQPYLNYQGQFSYIFKQKYIATFYVLYGDKATVQLPYQSPDELRLIYQTINMDFKRSIGLNLTLPFRVGYVWDASATANILNQREKARRFHDLSFDNHKWIFYGELNNTFRFSPGTPLALSVDFACITPSIQGCGELSGLWRIDAGLKWQFGKKRCCELDMKADDLFNRWSPTLTIKSNPNHNNPDPEKGNPSPYNLNPGPDNGNSQDFRMKVYDMTRNLRITFIWRFNGFKPKSPPTPDTSRFGTSN